MKLLTQNIKLTTVIFALATAMIGLFTSIKNASEIKSQNEEIKQLREIVLSSNLSIDSPAANEIINNKTYKKMHGSIGALPHGYKLYVLASDFKNYFLMYPPAEVLHTQNEWSQRNILLPTKGQWELVVCIADQKAVNWFESRVENNNWSGFPSLPDGVEIIKKVIVLRQ